MMQPAPRLLPNFLGPAFNRFLFAVVGTDRHGGQLSVVSALARLDLDAWAEAAALARLPRNVAVLRLSGLLRKYVEIPQITQEAELVAARLIALLPEGATPRALHKAPSRLAAALGGAGLGMLIALGVMIGLQFAGPSPSPHKAAAAASSAPAALSQAPAAKLP
jgi:hypothetical protein